METTARAVSPRVSDGRITPVQTMSQKNGLLVVTTLDMTASLISGLVGRRRPDGVLPVVTGPDAVAIRRGGHPEPSRIAVRRLDPLPSGFLLEVEEFWDHGGQQWYCRELMRADVDAGSIVDLSVYCTGDWDAARVAEHARMVHLPRP